MISAFATGKGGIDNLQKGGVQVCDIGTLRLRIRYHLELIENSI